MTALIESLQLVEVDIAMNGEQALERYKEIGHQGKKYLMILMDIFMPVMGGHESTQKIREIEKEWELPRTPIIGCSSSTDDNTTKKCMDVGMDELQAKPISRSNLEAIISRELGRL